MFIAVVCDLASDDRLVEVDFLLGEYGFTKVFGSLYESATLKEKMLARLKRDIDRKTDALDTIRFYQYPIDDTFVITTLHNKRWKRIVVKK